MANLYRVSVIFGIGSKSARTGDHIVTPVGNVTTPKTAIHPFFSMCDDFRATFPAVVISDNPVSLYGPNFRDGFPVNAQNALRDQILYGGLDNMVPVPDNVRLVQAVHDPAGVAKGDCLPVCVGFESNVNGVPPTKVNACPACGIDSSSQSGGADINTCGSCVPLAGIVTIDICNPCSPTASLAGGIFSTTLNVCQCDPNVQTSLLGNTQSSGVNDCSCNPYVFVNHVGTSTVGVNACTCNPTIAYGDGVASRGAGVNTCQCDPRLTADDGTGSAPLASVDPCSSCHPSFYVIALGTHDVDLCNPCNPMAPLPPATNGAAQANVCNPCDPGAFIHDPPAGDTLARASLCGPCGPTASAFMGSTGESVVANTCGCDPGVSASGAVSYSTPTGLGCVSCSANDLIHCLLPCQARLATSPPIFDYNSCTPCNPYVLVGVVTVYDDECNKCGREISVNGAIVGNRTLLTCATIAPGNSEEAQTSASKNNNLAPNFAITPAALGCNLPLYCLLDGAGNVRHWSGTSDPVLGVINVPLVAPDLTSVHYLLLAPDSLDGEANVDGATLGFYNFAVSAPASSVLNANVGPFVPGSSSGGYGFATHVAANVPVGIVGKLLLGKTWAKSMASCAAVAKRNCNVPAVDLGDVIYFYQEDGFGNVCAGACTSALNGPLAPSPMQTLMACVTGSIEAPSSGVAVKLVAERASTNCGVTGDGTPGVKHTFVGGSVAVGIDFHGRESRRSTFDLLTVTRDNGITAKIGLSEKAANGRFRYAGGNSLDKATIDAVFDTVNVGTHSISLKGKMKDGLHLIYTPEPFVDPGPTGASETASNVLPAAYAEQVAGPGSKNAGIKEIDVTLGTRSEDTSTLTLKLTELRSKQDVIVRHDADYATMTFENQQDANQHIEISVSESDVPSPVSMQANMTRTGSSFAIGLRAWAGPPSQANVDVSNGWVSDIHIIVEMEEGTVNVDADIFSNLHVLWEDHRQVQFDTPYDPLAYPAPMKIHAYASFDGNILDVLLGGIQAHTKITLDYPDQQATLTSNVIQDGPQTIKIYYLSIPAKISDRKAWSVDAGPIVLVPDTSGQISWNIVADIAAGSNNLTRAKLSIEHGAIKEWAVKIVNDLNVTFDGRGDWINSVEYTAAPGGLTATYTSPNPKDFVSFDAVNAIADLDNGLKHLDLKIVEITESVTFTLDQSSGVAAPRICTNMDPLYCYDPPAPPKTCHQLDQTFGTVVMQAETGASSWTMKLHDGESDITSVTGFYKSVNFNLPCADHVNATKFASLTHNDAKTEFFAPRLSSYDKATLDIRQTSLHGDITTLVADSINSVTLNISPGWTNYTEKDNGLEFNNLNMDPGGTLTIAQGTLYDFTVDKNFRDVRCEILPPPHMAPSWVYPPPSQNDVRMEFSQVPPWNRIRGFVGRAKGGSMDK